MRKSASWMEQLDDRILEYLREEGPSTPWEIAFDTDVRMRRVKTRCDALANAEFLAVRPRKHLDDRYTITTWGEEYLAGNVDANQINPQPGIRPPHATRPGWWAGFS